MIDLLWNKLLGWPILYVIDRFQVVPPLWLIPIIKIILLLFILYLVFAIGKRARKMLRKMLRKDLLYDPAEAKALAGGDSFQQSLLAARDLDSTVASLKRARNYIGMAEAYAAVNRHKEAARWFKKGGDRVRAAVELAKAGKTLKAAKMLMKEGDYATAGRFYAEKGKYTEAAGAYERAGMHAKAGSAYAQAGNFNAFFESYRNYFANPPDTPEQQVEAADECLKILTTDPGRTRVTDEQRKALLAQIAARFEQAKRLDLAASLFKEAGELARAGEVYAQAGKLEEAAACMRSAGKTQEAARLAGRFYEAKGKWREAGAAYAQAGDFMNAGEMFARAAEAVRAAECFERAGEFYRAGVAYAHAQRYENAIKALQNMKENHPNFDASRALLGRCFYEMHDYAHCAGALENHLQGKRVDTQNSEYFYMWALALEQLGKLEESRQILIKIRTVNVGYKDVTQRISNIASRISMAGSATVYTPQPGVAPSSGGPGASAAAVATQVMQSVESSLGGRYVLEKELGRGGMGVVYLARDSQLERPVALKFLGNLVDSSEEFRQRFVREARTAAKITHPNIIAIYDISASVGKAYIAMEYVDGPSLHKYLSAKGALKPREAINIIVQACSALAAIHDAGIVHRDIKPDNMLIAKGGLVKLTDFGLAKAEDSRMTRTGVVMGTPSYMAPEQVLGKEADVRSDIYSMGLVLHECLTGKTTFLGPDVLERQLKEMPDPPGKSVPGIPPELDAIVMKCIAKDPKDRYQTVRDLVTDLRAVTA